MLNYLEYIAFVFLFNFLFIHCLVAPTVYIPDEGTVIGRYLKMFRTQNIVAYLGIPYAEASRFSPPEVGMVYNKNKIRNTTNFAPDCWQKPPMNSQDNIQIVHKLLTGNFKNDVPTSYDENCLHLNIFIPDGSTGTKSYAVIVWFHGGDFSYGSPKDIDPFQLVFKQKVIVVTVSYRLNIFGFLSTGDGESQGNFGLMDQSAALFWVKKNINYFGGDENEITIMGHSAGAISVGLHLISGEWSKEAFSKAIIMSGNPLTENAIKTPIQYKNIITSIANTFGCIREPTSMLIQCLKRIDPKIILDNIPPIEWGPVIDSGLSNTSYPFITDYPIELFKRGNIHKVPLLIGITDMEDVLSLWDDAKDKFMTSDDFNNYLEKIAVEDIQKIISNDTWCSNADIVLDSLNYIYKNNTNENEEGNTFQKFINFETDRMYVSPLYLLSDIMSKYNNNYVYLFNVKPKTQFYKLPQWVRVPKYYDQLFIWGVPYMNRTDIVKEWISQDKKISEIVMTLWANFAKFSNPTISNVYVKWNSYNSKNKSILEINENFNYNILTNNHIVQFWNDFYPKILKFTAECCNTTNMSTSNLEFMKIKYYIALVLICFLFI